MPLARLQALRNGHIPWEEMLDLKGFKIHAARDRLAQFIQNQAQKASRHERCVLIVHGQEGSHDAPPLIKNLINQWLPQFNEVLAFHSAQVRDGGAGAIYDFKKVLHTDLPSRLSKNTQSSS